MNPNASGYFNKKREEIFQKTHINTLNLYFSIINPLFLELNISSGNWIQ